MHGENKRPCELQKAGNDKTLISAATTPISWIRECSFFFSSVFSQTPPSPSHLEMFVIFFVFYFKQRFLGVLSNKRLKKRLNILKILFDSTLSILDCYIIEYECTIKKIAK